MSTPEQTPFTLLLVEDEPADAHLIEIAFREGQAVLDLQHVEDGVEALRYLRREGAYAEAPRPDLILLDLNMPRMDGRRFLEEQKRDDALRAIPVVVLTTSEAEADILSAYDLGAAGYIVKPFDFADFLEVARKLEDYWVTLIRRPPVDG